MDDYPKHLAPAFDDYGAIDTSFPEWWAIASSSFQNVPVDVAEQWLHENWNASLFSWMRSADYSFRLVDWPCDQLVEIASGANDWRYSETVERGRFLVQSCSDIRLVEYVLANRTVPRPIIVYDNRDGKMANDSHAPSWHRDAPASLIIVEGHTRFELAAYLHSQQAFGATTPLWMMERHSYPTLPLGDRLI